MSYNPLTEFPPLAPSSRWRAPLNALLLVLALLPLALVVQLLLFQPTIVYRLQGGALEIRGGSGLLGNRRTIPVASIGESAEVTLGRGRRVAGTALPGYCAGRFSYDDLGAVWQVTDCSRNVLLLRVAGEPRPILLTPPDRAALLDALRSGREGDFSPPPRSQPLGWTLLAVLFFLVMLPTAGYVLLAVTRGSRRLRYRVAGGELEVQLLLWRRRFRLAGSRARRFTPRRVWKLSGAAIPGYAAGWFKVDGESTRVYATTVRQEGVLVEGERRVFVTPADVPAFLAALRGQGVHVA
jgi:hypothetical protein